MTQNLVIRPCGVRVFEQTRIALLGMLVFWRDRLHPKRNPRIRRGGPSLRVRLITFAVPTAITLGADLEHRGVSGDGDVRYQL
ncbi:MAG: hypothetical protein AAFR46_10255 [Pseudomonadota bacterium]